MDDQEELLKQVVTVLENMGVPYMMGGSIALNAWAVPRMTHDLDVVVDLPEERISEFCEHFSPDRYYIDPEMMRDAFRGWDQPGLGMYSFTDMDTGFKVDLFPLRPNDAAQQTALDNCVTINVLEDLPAAVYTPADLLVQKLRWYVASQSERQFRDCLNLVLTDLKRPTRLISWNYVQDWASRLGTSVEQAWALVKSAVEQTQSEENQR